MIYLYYILIAAAAIMGIALAAIATQKNIVAIIIAVELMFLASTVAVVGFFSLNANGSALIALLAIFGVAAVEVITLIAVYVYMKARGYTLDVSLLSKLKW